MDSKDTESQASFETVVNRLIAQNEQLDRELEALMKRGKIPPEIFQDTEQRIARLDPRLRREAERRLARELTPTPAAPVHSDRPSHAELISRFKGRLIRA